MEPGIKLRAMGPAMIIAIVIRRDTTHRTQPPFNCFNELWIASRVANRDGTSYLPRTTSSSQSRSLINDLNEFTHSINATSSMGISLSLSLLGGYGPARVATMNPGWVGATQLSVYVWETI